MISIGITGQSGFVGTHLYNTLGEFPEKYNRVPFENVFFEDEQKLRVFVRQCDVIVHLAAMMRCPKEGVVYEINMRLVNQLINAMNAEKVSPNIFFSSSKQEDNGSEYGKCKLEGRILLENWAKEHHTGFCGMIFPNLFGIGARPNSHSFIATFCYKLTHNEIPQVLVDNIVQLKYIGNLFSELFPLIEKVNDTKCNIINLFKPDYAIKVTEVLSILQGFKDAENSGNEPDLTSKISQDLFETYQSYKAYSLD